MDISCERGSLKPKHFQGVDYWQKGKQKVADVTNYCEMLGARCTKMYANVEMRIVMQEQEQAQVDDVLIDRSRKREFCISQTLQIKCNTVLQKLRLDSCTFWKDLAVTE
jgi:hypothetical protein